MRAKRLILRYDHAKAGEPVVAQRRQDAVALTTGQLSPTGVRNRFGALLDPFVRDYDKTRQFFQLWLYDQATYLKGIEATITECAP